MPDYSGKFQYCDGNGAALAQGPCRISFDEDSFIATPASGAAIAFDLGDVDVFAHGSGSCSFRFTPAGNSFCGNSALRSTA